MSIDYFQSHTVSLILSWIFSVSLISSFIALFIGVLFKKLEGVPRPFSIPILLWIILCMVVLSPFRYIVLQLCAGIAYPFQSLSAFLSVFLLVLYIPIVFSILFAIGVALPLFGVAITAGLKEPISKARLFLAAIISPFLFLVGSYLFYLALPYAAYTTYWLKARDVIRTTNGPAEYVYKYLVEQLTPLQFPEFIHEIGLENLSAKERLRGHVAAVYLGQKQYSYYMDKVYSQDPGKKTKPKPDSLSELPEKWPEFTAEELSEVSAVMAKAVQEPLEDNDLERIKRVYMSYSKRVGRYMTREEADLLPKIMEIIYQYNYELGRCLLLSIDSKQPVISDELERLRARMETLGFARKSKLDADFQKIVRAARGDVWTDEFGQQYYPPTRENVLAGLKETRVTRVMKDNFDKVSEVFKELAEE